MYKSRWPSSTPSPNSPYGLCGRKATLEEEEEDFRAQELRKSRGGRPGLPVSDSPYGLRGRKATLEEEEEEEEQQQQQQTGGQ